MSIAAPSSFTFSGHSECSTSYGIPSSSIKHSLPPGQTTPSPWRNSGPFPWLPTGNNPRQSRVSVAADYSDSLPDSSSCFHNGYHPLEDLKVGERMRETKLTAAEVARTTLEACSTALLVFPGNVHCEPHEQVSWSELPYVIDDYGDIFFEVFDEENILEDPGSISPVTVFIGMDIPSYDNQKMEDPAISDFINDKFSSEEDYFEIMDFEASDAPMDWGMPSKSIHPVYFAKCMSKAINKVDKKVDHTSNGLSILGCIRPIFPGEEFYLRQLFMCEDDDVNNLDWKDAELPSFDPTRDEKTNRSIIYRLEIMRIDLFSVYGIQCEIEVQDFLDAEPDILVHSTAAILERFSENGIRCDDALKELCKKKGLRAEGANLIGVDSLGIDVRVHSGVEMKTHRFPFKMRATSEAAAEKQIRQLLVPRSRRKKPRNLR
ncbi:hypothetical protein MLD38_036296 [Melastoma candidum]|uniref:Uncharacterized protein n=1 Tax=Melastoma candidum TaxID=119954 RepID=A0ACB9LJ99_9MYRT|nr:hypothetical protein MLD38_036296 [Melastoma candidum]